VILGPATGWRAACIVLSSACVYARHPRIKPHLSHFSFVESCHFRDQEAQLPGVGMDFGEHIPTSSDESILGRDVPISDSEDRPPTRIPRGRQGRTASSGGGLPSHRLLDASSAALEVRAQAQRVSGLVMPVWQGGAQKAFAKATDVSAIEALLAKPCKTCSRGCFQQFRCTYLWSWTFVEHFGP